MIFIKEKSTHRILKTNGNLLNNNWENEEELDDNILKIIFYMLNFIYHLDII